MSFKVLLIYPNQRGMNMLPPAIGLLSSILKEDGNTVELFDTTYYEKLDESGSSEVDSDYIKTEKLKQIFSLMFKVTRRWLNLNTLMQLLKR